MRHREERLSQLQGLVKARYFKTRPYVGLLVKIWYCFLIFSKMVLHQHNKIYQHQNSQKYVQREFLCSTRRDRRTEGRTDMTGLTVSSSNCSTKAPNVEKCSRPEEITYHNSCPSLWYFWLPHTCSIFGVSLLDLPNNTRKILEIYIFGKSQKER